MRKIERKILETLFTLSFIEGLDNKNVEHVLITNEANMGDLTRIESFKNNNFFEAYENHIHLLRKTSLFSWQLLKRDCPLFGMLLLNILNKQFPQKHFRVYVFLAFFQGLVIRFHEKRELESNWSDEEERKAGRVSLILES